MANVSKEKKTKQGYLKDGFVVDSSDTEEDLETLDSSEECNDVADKEAVADDGDIIIDELGSELSEESYDYSEDEA